MDANANSFHNKLSTTSHASLSQTLLGSQTSGYRWSCNIPQCKSTFARASDLVRHQQSIHGPKQACAYLPCSYATARKDKMNEHIRKKHREFLDSQASSVGNATTGRGAYHTDGMIEGISVNVDIDTEWWLSNGLELNATAPLNSNFDAHDVFDQQYALSQQNPFDRQATFDLQHTHRLRSTYYLHSSLEPQNTIGLEHTYELQNNSSLHRPRHRRNALGLPNDPDYKLYSACDTTIGTLDSFIPTIPDDPQYPMVLSSSSSDTTTLPPGTPQPLYCECWMYQVCLCSTSQAFSRGCCNWF